MNEKLKLDLTDREIIAELLTKFKAVERAYLKSFEKHSDRHECAQLLVQALSDMSIFVFQVEQTHGLRQGELVKEG